MSDVVKKHAAELYRGANYWRSLRIPCGVGKQLLASQSDIGMGCQVNLNHLSKGLANHTGAQGKQRFNCDEAFSSERMLRFTFVNLPLTPRDY